VPRKPSTEQRLAALERLVKGRGRTLILLQNNPDPDAIASAAALKFLLKERSETDAEIAHDGIVGRAENRSMLRYLGLVLHPAADLASDDFDLVAMVDTQPGFGNNPIDDPEKVDVVIDHHNRAEGVSSVTLCDVRPRYGATSTILAEYLYKADITPPAPVATALAYGIQSDTQDFGRETSQADIDMFTWLYPLTNKRLLSRIENEQEPREYFTAVSRALRDARTYGSTAVCWLGRTINPDMTGEIADLLLRLDEANWALCQGLYKGTLYLSLRTDERNADADGVIKKILGDLGDGGGHEMLAGGQVSIERDSFKQANKVRREIERNFLDHFELDPKTRRPLVSRASEDRKSETPKDPAKKK
jgi:nanoRNase/pAp phosphatase (c-di-AMP/oligoRNAs hydrolase)